ncbi:integrase catalytic domain-containing protein [Trichonephila clavipes]|nr:integrase catalytic domain-containing protein [Trichonephila clavipes]
MTEIKESIEPEYTYYIPHHGIYRPKKSATKLRTVFNDSALTTNGRSLNSIQYNGGVIQDDHFSLLVRFPKHIYAFTADIRQMYRMVDIDEGQRSLQRILWKEDVNEPVKVYQLIPFLAMRTLKKISIHEGENFPLAASVPCEDFYMDDVWRGANSLEVAKTLHHQLIDILQTAQMSLHKWCGDTSKRIPNNHFICDLIIKHYHVRYLHTGTEATLANIRTRFRIAKGRSKVKRIIKQCIQCLKVIAKGRPSDIFSDNGTNFVGANIEFHKILKELFEKEISEKFEDFLASESIKNCLLILLPRLILEACGKLE